MLEPQDFGELYQTLWEQILEGDVEGSRSLIKTLQTIAASEAESDQLGAKAVLQQLSGQMHDMVRTQELGPLQRLERHDYEELLMLLDDYTP
ncbi:hypothetical protein [Ammoniphilus sp. 3BR4]|uniref:hypothetical protein n=1 Tax=Ammoniphilus sp. 3BR4 TaxID=3158265 RepID=UPI0034666051